MTHIHFTRTDCFVQVRFAWLMVLSLIMPLAGCRAPWQVSTPRNMEVRQLIKPTEPEEEGQAGEQSRVNASRVASRMRSRGGAPSPVSRKTSAKNPQLKTTPKNAIEQMLTRSGLLPGHDQQDPEEQESQALMRKMTIKERIEQEMRRREKLKQEAGTKSSDASGVRVRWSDEEVPAPKPSSGESADSEGRQVLHRKQTESKVGEINANPVVAAQATEAQLDDSKNSLTGTGRVATEKLGKALLSQLEAQASSTMEPKAKIDLEKKVRLVQMALGDLESAQEPIEGLETQTQEYVSRTLKSLHEATSADGNPSTSRKLSKALETHREATQSLASVASLQVKNTAFCTEIDGFGEIKRFSSYRFRPDQQVLLYSELENFVSERTEKGFCTKLQGNYEIIDDQGNRVIDQVLPEDMDVCAQKRRDFYIAYRFHLPKKISPGTYRLRLVIEDMQGHKFGHSELEFKIAE